MEDNINKLLTEEKSVEDVNLDAQKYVMLDNTSRPLPLNNISTTVNQAKQADKERQGSTNYRFYGHIKPIINNALYNNNIKIFIDKRPRVPLTATTNPNIGFSATSTVQSPDIIEKDGWFGYHDDDPFEAQSVNSESNQYNDNKSSLCEFIPFDPGFDRINFIDKDGSPNYKLNLTYPAYHRDDIPLIQGGGITLADGIPLLNLSGITHSVRLNGRLYTAFRTSINHGLRPDDLVKLHNGIDNTGTELALGQRFFKVVKLGNQKNEQKERVFVLDINPNEIDIIVGRSTVKRVVNGIESSYYLRVFSAITTEQTDYQLFPAGFAKTSYDDQEAAFNFIKDIDLSPDIYRDNLGRPLSEVYLTISKLRNDVANTLQSRYWSNVTSGAPFWTEITPGFLTTKHERINYNLRSFGDTSFGTTPQTFFSSVNESDTEFMGDIVEYNTEELEERNLVDIFHRINTEYRENRSLYTSNPQKENKKEGYIYKPHYRIKVRDFSTYIEDGDANTTIGIPDYAILSYSGTNGTTVMKWRDYLDIGIYDEGGRGVDYPFESGSHYIFLSNRFYWRRQDPPCDFIFTSETYRSDNISDIIMLAERLKDPKFVQILSMELADPNFIPALNTINIIAPGVGNPFPVNTTIRMVDYFGEYELGSRDVPGGCVDIGLISTKDIDDVC